MAGMGLGWGPTDRGLCIGNRSAGQRRGSTVPDETQHFYLIVIDYFARTGQLAVPTERISPARATLLLY